MIKRRIIMKKILVFLILGLLFVSCTYGTKEGVIQKSDKSFLHFIGNAKNVTVIIDDTEPIILEEESSVQRYAPHLLYQVKPGKHTIKVYRDEQLIVDRIIFIATGETKEVEI